MTVLITALREIYGLFVEDGTLAVAVLLWIGVAGVVFPHLPGGNAWCAPTLFLGLVVLLLENLRRSSR